MGSQREVLKPFSVIVSSIADKGVREVGLSGTQQNTGIYCNYIAVQDISNNDTGDSALSYFTVAPSGMPLPLTSIPGITLTVLSIAMVGSLL